MINHIEIKELISADFDGQTTTQEKKLVEEHLKECASCQEYSRHLHKLSATLNEWTNEDLSPDLEQKVQRGLKEAMMSREKIALMQRPLFKVGVGGGSVLVAILVLVLSMQVYSKRGLQGRLRDAADNIGMQYSSEDAQLAGRHIESESLRSDMPHEVSSTINTLYAGDNRKDAQRLLKENVQGTLTAPSQQLAYWNKRDQGGFQESSYRFEINKNVLADKGKKKSQIAFKSREAGSGLPVGSEVRRESKSTRTRSVAGSSSSTVRNAFREGGAGILCSIRTTTNSNCKKN